MTNNGSMTKWIAIIVASVSITINIVLGSVIAGMNTRIRAVEHTVARIEVLFSKLDRIERDVVEMKVDIKELQKRNHE